MAASAPFVPFGDHDTREFKLDALGQAVEDLLSMLRHFGAYIVSDDGSADSSADEANCSDGWADPDCQSPSFRHVGDECSPVVLARDIVGHGSDVHFDPHPYASKKRKARTVLWEKGAVVKPSKRRSRVSYSARISNSTGHRSKVTIPVRAQLPSQGNKRTEKRSLGEIVETGKSYRASPTGSERNKNATESTSSVGSADESTAQAVHDEMAPSKSKPSRRWSERLNTKIGSFETCRKAQRLRRSSEVNVGKNSNRRSNKIGKGRFFSGPILPDIENSSPNYDANRSDEFHRDKVGISDRMEKWLDSNVDGFDHDGTERQLTLRLRNGRNNLRRGKDCLRQNSSGSGVSSPQTLDPTREFLFSSLYRRSEVSNDRIHKPSIFTGSSVRDLCQSVLNADSDAACRAMLYAMCDKFAIDNPRDPADSTLAFRTIHEMLKTEGATTLQDLVSRDSTGLDRFVAVLVVSLRLLRLDVNKILSPGDGTVFEIFGPPRCSLFFDYVVLQAVESIMSLFQPAAWALQVKDRRRVLFKLEPLRDELAQHTEMTERVCCCLGQELGQQEWRNVRGGEHIYVSAIDPDLWRAFLSSATELPKVTTVRFSAFVNQYPRCEVEAIWCLLAYFVGASSQFGISDGKRWQFVSLLLTNGSLSFPATTLLLTPSKEQMDAAAADLSNLSDLVASNAMGNLPRRDNMVLDLLQRAITLQGDELFLNEDARAASIPSVHDEARNGIFALFGNHQLSTDLIDHSFASVARMLSSADVKISWMGQPLLLPSSRTLRCCLSLLVAWKGRIPSNKAKRLQCFDNAVKALVKILTNEGVASDSMAESGPQERDLFGEAFASSAVADTGGYAELRRIIFRRESAAYLAILSHDSCGFYQTGGDHIRKQGEVDTLCKQVWALLSDDGMRQRRDWIAFNGGSLTAKAAYVGESFRLYIAAKSLSFLILSLSGVIPFSYGALLGSSQAQGSDPVGDGRLTTALPYLFSCLTACLDCACDKNDALDIVSCIVCCISITLVCVSRQFPLHHDVSLGQLGRADCSLVSEAILPMLLDSIVLQRSFRAVTSSSFCDVGGDDCLRILVALIRRVVSLCRSEAPVQLQTSVVTESSAETEEFYDDIDDAVLASIDLCGGGGPRNGVNGQSAFLSSMYDLLSDALGQAKPSSRYAIVQSDAYLDTTTMSSKGMKLVAKRSDVLCCCLADITAARLYPVCPVTKFWVVGTRSNPCSDRDDAQYFKTLGQYFTRQLCSRHHLLNVVEMIRRGKENFLFDLLESLLESTLLRKLPSCNLERIESASGSIGEEKGFTELISFGKGSPKTLCNRLTEFRTFAFELGRIFVSDDSQSTYRSVGDRLISFSRESNGSRPRKLIPSLERECFDRFRLFRDLIVMSRTDTGASLSFERLSSLLLASCSEELAHLLQKIGIQDLAHQNVQSAGFDKAKLFETVACFSELYVCVLSVVFRSLRSDCSDNFVALLHHFCDQFISPLLSSNNFHLLGSLNDIYALCGAVLAADLPVAVKNVKSASSTFDSKPYCDVLRHALIRRSREFVFSVATGGAVIPRLKLTGILGAFVAAGAHGNESTTSLICRSFSTNEHVNTVVTEENQAYGASPLTDAIADEFARFEDLSPLTVDQIISCSALKRFVVRQILAPKLAIASIDLATKVGVLRLVQGLLDLEHEERSTADTARLDPLILCSLAKGIGASAQAALFSTSSVNEELLTAAFACARSLVNLPAASVDMNAVGWLVDWACTSLEDTGSEISLPARYIWFFCCWLKCLGDFIFDGCCTDRTCSAEDLHVVRERLRDNELASGKRLWPCIGTERQSSSDRLLELESRLFPTASLLASGVTITNVYAVRNRGPTPYRGPLEKWVPSLNVRSAVGQFTAKIKYASPGSFAS